MLLIEDVWLTTTEIGRLHDGIGKSANGLLRNMLKYDRVYRRRRNGDGPWEYRAKETERDSIRQKLSSTIDRSKQRRKTYVTQRL